MAKAPTEIRSLARSHGATALRVLVGIMRQSKAPPAARIAAAVALLDRGWGKPGQAMELAGPDGGAVQVDVEGARERLRALIEGVASRIGTGGDTGGAD